MTELESGTAAAQGPAVEFVVIGIGADGWDGLGGRARNELRAASVIYGSARQLALLPGDLGGCTTPWTSPMSGHLHRVLHDAAGTDRLPVAGRPADSPLVRIHLLASGDPMFYGLGSTVVEAVGADRVTVIPAPSSVSLAAARLGWDLARTPVHSLVTAEPESLAPLLTDGGRVLVLSRDASSPAQVAEVLRRTGFGPSTLTVLGELGGPGESRYTGRADGWNLAQAPALNVLAVECASGSAHREGEEPAEWRRSAAPGLPDEAFVHDGQLTKQTIRAVTVCALAPAEGQVLWDVGAGSGSVGIEWLRQTRTGRAVAFESAPERAERIGVNARAHGVAGRLEVAGAAPEALTAAPAPDTIFVGGGLDAAVLERCWTALTAGGRLVANAVTLETEQLLVAAHARHGGALTRLSVERAGSLGAMTAWRPALPVVQWAVTR